MQKVPKREKNKYDEDDYMSDQSPGANQPGCKLFGRVLGLLLIVAINGFLFVGMNFYHNRIPFLTDDFPEWLPYGNLALVVTLVVQIVLVFIEGRAVRPLLEAGSNLTAACSAILLLVIFPFSFELTEFMAPMSLVARAIIIIIIIGTSIGFFANLVSFFVHLAQRE